MGSGRQSRSLGFFISVLTAKPGSRAMATGGLAFDAFGLRISRVLRFCDLAIGSAQVPPYAQRDRSQHDGEHDPQADSHPPRSILIELLAVTVELGHEGCPMGTVPNIRQFVRR